LRNLLVIIAQFFFGLVLALTMRGYCKRGNNGMFSRIICAAVLALGAAVITPSAASAADIVSTFNVTGHDTHNSQLFGTCSGSSSGPCPFSGTLTVDVTAGTATGIDIDLEGLLFTSVVSVTATGSGVEIDAEGSANPGTDFFLEFTTATPGSLVGFDGGTITEAFTQASLESIYVDPAAGTITPTVPEPSSWALLAVALAGCFAYARRKATPAS
jgi:hypothetical protein